MEVLGCGRYLARQSSHFTTGLHCVTLLHCGYRHRVHPDGVTLCYAVLRHGYRYMMEVLAVGGTWRDRAVTSRRGYIVLHCYTVVTGMLCYIVTPWLQVHDGGAGVRAVPGATEQSLHGGVTLCYIVTLWLQAQGPF